MEKYFISFLNYDKSPKEARTLHSHEIHFSGNILRFAPFFPSSFFAATVSFEYLLQITEDSIKQIVFFTHWATYTYGNLASS